MVPEEKTQLEKTKKSLFEAIKYFESAIEGDNPKAKKQNFRDFILKLKGIGSEVSDLLEDKGSLEVLDKFEPLVDEARKISILLKDRVVVTEKITVTLIKGTGEIEEEIIESTPPMYSTPIFRCYQDFKNCMENSQSKLEKADCCVLVILCLGKNIVPTMGGTSS